MLVLEHSYGRINPRGILVLGIALALISDSIFD